MSDIDPVREISYGAISGMVGKVVEFPFDTIKVRLQSSTSNDAVNSISMIKKTYAKEGFINGFYKGFKAPLVGACLETSVLFTSYNWSSSIFINNLAPNSTEKYNQDTLPFWSKCVSGGFAGFMASFVLTPVELIKCQLQVSNIADGSPNKNHGYFYFIKKVLKNDGIFGYWNGLSSTLVREVVGTAIWFGTYEYINGYFKRSPPSWIPNDGQLLISGAMAGVLFNWAMFPVDTIKSNIQTYEVLHGPSHKINTWYIIKKLATKKGGIKNFYNGLGITLVRAVPANALIFFTYEQLKRNF